MSLNYTNHAMELAMLQEIQAKIRQQQYIQAQNQQNYRRNIPYPSMTNKVEVPRQIRPQRAMKPQQSPVNTPFDTQLNQITDLTTDFPHSLNHRTPNMSFPSQPCISIMQKEEEKSPQNVDSARYKTEMCRPFEETGHCRYGTKCQFAHGRQELRCLNRHPRYKTELCRTYHTTGFCTYGQRCNFIHNEDERINAAPNTAISSINRPAALTINDSTGVSPASSINGDYSPSLSPGSSTHDEVFTPFHSRLSPTPSYSSTDGSCYSPPETPSEEFLPSLTQEDLKLTLQLLSQSLANKLNL